MKISYDPIQKIFKNFILLFKKHMFSYYSNLLKIFEILRILFKKRKRIQRAHSECCYIHISPWMLGKRDITSLLIIFISSLCFGINTVYGASVTTSIKNIYPNLAKYEKEWSWFNNGARLSAGLGSFCFTPIIKWFGRRLSISIFGFINGIFFLLILAAGDEMMIYLLIVRIFHGLIWGVMSVLSLVYLFEMAPSNSYGFVGCMHQFFNVCGIVLVYLLSAFVDFQILSIINAVISFIFSGLIWITRDSPVSIRDKKIEKQKSLNTKSKSPPI
ncbi:hypothetical protein TRFO_41367 [Tritrichomonas foetus]|uniref:Major facilitator superfamily (MFS) profile domain-containing protein n=1 Tax=Tritrichomonas foetus TaxID=1144522 RepID=A0A1J4L0P2_9EUKA|nr:hypothetical protein TRFO_41367 [Tritrichomonas foetus]|eukprot:OHT17003.1 hypothetical protein TRFO_41367 [Tritrichomonas foetus]